MHIHYLYRLEFLEFEMIQLEQAVKGYKEMCRVRETRAMNMHGWSTDKWKELNKEYKKQSVTPIEAQTTCSKDPISCYIKNDQRHRGILAGHHQIFQEGCIRYDKFKKCIQEMVGEGRRHNCSMWCDIRIPNQSTRN